MTKESLLNTSTATEVFPKLLKDDTLSDFLKELASTNDKTFGVLSLPIEAIDPLACIEVLGKEDAYQYYWEKPHIEFAIAAGNTIETFSAKGDDRFNQLRKTVSSVEAKTMEFTHIEHSFAGLHLLGGAAFFEDQPSESWKRFTSSCFTLPKWMVIKDGQLGILTINIKAEEHDTEESLREQFLSIIEDISPIFNINTEDVLELPNVRPNVALPTSSESYEKWTKSVQKAKQHIEQQDFDKIVLAREITLRLESEIIPTFVLNRLRQQYPNCYSFMVKFPGSKTFIGCSPERLVSFHKKYLRTDALAGSIKRGQSATEDVVFEKQLLNSTKDNNEHRFVTKAIEERLLDVTQKIERGEKPTIKKLSNVQHLYTPIRAWIDEYTDQLEIIKALHPTPAVGGYPWKKAKNYIKELEHIDRGWYAGPIGWLNTKGHGEFAVAIRSGLIHKNKAQFFAGCGIVKDSDPKSEWEETNLKFLPMLSALANE